MVQTDDSSLIVFLKRLRYSRVALLIFVVGALLYISLSYKRNQPTKVQTKKSPTSQSKVSIDTKTVVAQVARLMELPKNEEPTIAIVSDKTKLVGQSFFQKAENGDKVLIYPVARQAILYRPSTDKIIEVAPVNIETSSSPSPSIKATVAIYNGTKKAGLAKSTETKIKNSFPDIQTLATANASQDYSKSLIIDMKGQFGEQAKVLADFLKGQVIKTIPEGEKSTSADILVIVAE